jgi:hypothetical protein
MRSRSDRCARYGPGMDAQTTEFPHAIGKVATRQLAAHGYTRYEQLATATTKELLAIHGVGPKAVRILGEELAARGLGFAS